ncbi:hypothetical protein EBZ80_11415, partial [bacterium]|nr:hypothetical protein [bacterium]
HVQLCRLAVIKRNDLLLIRDSPLLIPTFPILRVTEFHIAIAIQIKLNRFKLVRPRLRKLFRRFFQKALSQFLALRLNFF